MRCAGHGDGEVAAAELGWGGVARGGGSSLGDVESGRDAWETTASRRWPRPSTAAGGSAQRRRR